MAAVFAGEPVDDVRLDSSEVCRLIELFFRLQATGDGFSADDFFIGLAVDFTFVQPIVQKSPFFVGGFSKSDLDDDFCQLFRFRVFHGFSCFSKDVAEAGKG